MRIGTALKAAGKRSQAEREVSEWEKANRRLFND